MELLYADTDFNREAPALLTIPSPTTSEGLQRTGWKVGDVTDTVTTSRHSEAL